MTLPTNLVQIERSFSASTGEFPSTQNGEGISKIRGSSGSLSVGGPLLQGVVSSLARGNGAQLSAASLVGGCVSFLDNVNPATWILPSAAELLQYIGKTNFTVKLVADVNSSALDEVDLSPAFDCTFEVGVGANVTLQTNTGISWHPTGLNSPSVVSPANVVLSASSSVTFRFFSGPNNTIRMTKLIGAGGGGGGGSGTVTSVGLTGPGEFTYGPAVTVSGNLSLTKASQTQNQVWASPNGASGLPVFRSLVAADLPPGVGTGTVTSVGLTGPTEFTYGPAVTASGSLSLTKVSQTQNQVWASPNGASGLPVFRALVAADLPPGVGTGTVTSVGLTGPAEFTYGPAVTGSGNLSLTKVAQAANIVYAGPSTGAATQPSFRALVAADIPQTLVNTNFVGHSVQIAGAASPVAVTGVAGPTVNNGNDMIGDILANMTGAGAWTITLTFATPFTLPPVVLISPGNALAANNNLWADATETQMVIHGTATGIGDVLLFYFCREYAQP